MQRSLLVLWSVTLTLWAHFEVPAQSPSPRRDRQGFPTRGILPKAETGALRFLDRFPKSDGRGVIVAIFDTGVDPAAPGLQVTTDGRPKIIDLIDATGDGDVPMSVVQEARDGQLEGLSGQMLKVDPGWTNPSGEFRLGVKPAYDLFPEELVRRLQQVRKRKWLVAQRAREHDLRRQIEEFGQQKSAKTETEQEETDQDAESHPSKKELQSRLDLLQQSIKKYDDPGPVLDCVVFHDGDSWQAVIDTNEDGDLRDETVLTDYRAERCYASFGSASQLNFSVNIFEEGQLLSIVTVSGQHGTHVAGIVAAYEAERPERNGLAPGAQIVSVKIGDNRLDGMETGTSLIRGLKAVVDRGCDLINMSYGEPTSSPDSGRLTEQFNRLVRESYRSPGDGDDTASSLKTSGTGGVIFVASAGNSGPALSTVGSPGGTTSAVIGVGAYVSPAMMDVEYTVRDKLSGRPYTWTSRGPTADGDWGVDIFAPGGAIAPVPPYSLQPHRRMNGTSMASPNACGNIALLLSALKQRRIDYSPASILRAIQNTARAIETADKLAQGPGLLQVDRAFDHLVGWHSALGELDELAVSIPSRDDARGILLREAADFQNPFEASVTVTPRFPEGTPPEEKLRFEIPIRLAATAKWVDVGEHLLLEQSGGSFHVKVDPTQLASGLHTAEIQGLSAGNPERGPLFRVPIVVTRPVSGKRHGIRARLTMDAGDTIRRFITVPEQARQARVRLKRTNAGGTRFLYLHAVQLEPGKSFEDAETKVTISLAEGESIERTIPVLPGRTLELCLAQYWSSLGATELALELSFVGFHASTEEIALPSDGGAIDVSARAVGEFETCQPSAKLTTLKRVLHPIDATTSVLSAERDGFRRHPEKRDDDSDTAPGAGHVRGPWESLRTRQLVLSYSWKQPRKGSVTFRIPRLHNLLYESPVDSCRIFVFDTHNQLVSARDMFADSVSLKPGEYRVQVELRQTAEEVWKSFEKLKLSAITELASSITVPIAKTRADAAANRGSYKQEELTSEELTTLWLRFPEAGKIPDSAKNGDILEGTLKLNSGAHSIPLRYGVSQAVPGASSATSKTEKNFAAAQREFELSYLKSLNWSKDLEQINARRNALLEVNPNDRELRVVLLHLADDDDRKDRLAEVVQLADDVISEVDRDQLQTYFGVRHALITADERKMDRERKRAREDLIDALYRKGRALAYKELPDVLEQHPIEDQAAHDAAFESNFQALAEWVDTKDKAYFLLHIRRLRRQGNFAQAVQILNTFIDSEPATYLYHKKRRDLYELLGWPDWRAYEQRWMLRRFPATPVPF